MKWVGAVTKVMHAFKHVPERLEGVESEITCKTEVLQTPFAIEVNLGQGVE